MTSGQVMMLPRDVDYLRLNPDFDDVLLDANADISPQIISRIFHARRFLPLFSSHSLIISANEVMLCVFVSWSVCLSIILTDLGLFKTLCIKFRKRLEAAELRIGKNRHNLTYNMATCTWLPWIQNLMTSLRLTLSSNILFTRNKIE